MPDNQADVTTVDVLIVGAGISGIDAAYRLKTQLPGKSYAMLEGRDSLGGTWDQFRYPGIRSDSDMFTFSFPFRPWKAPKAISEGSLILNYLTDTVREFGIDRQIRYGHRVVRAAWSSVDAAWTVDVEVGPQREPVTYTCSFLYLCTGYYSYESGHSVPFPGQSDFAGRIVHPQFWPQDLDYAGKRVVVIGSGATAVTLVPAMADKAELVTMLQRSPSYVLARPAGDAFADRARRWLPAALAHRLIRAKNATLAVLAYQYLRRWPTRGARLIRKSVVEQLSDALPADPHFVPRYAPWDQRLCFVPDGDLFAAIRDRKATVVTDQIDTFTEKGITLASGDELEADIIVTATGLKMVALGQIDVTVDGERIQPHDSTVYKGLMLSGIPNLAWCVGYINNSWTLRADLSARYVCRLLKHMDQHDYVVAVPELPAGAGGTAARPIINLASGYVQRAAAALPTQGDGQPWQMRQNYLADVVGIRLGRIDDGAIRFTRANIRTAAPVSR
ncbi:MAG TPA: NAD(P)/FAD-dependent oxidoreductase [Pseudonocardiaceae bacterium]|jgi:cation diffusion facilitator CzcD-associated flavoprotein CzcO|nr:NAD(P)/FAD-dependent oxidoreductase [Pseudonocardiaceae bacterium]